MYVPPHFEETDAQEIERLISDFPLAALVCHHDGDFIVNHIPLLHEADNLFVGHVAKANDLHRLFADGTDAVAVFTGEDSYISPNWYPSKQITHEVVPTWNYQIVHLHGRIKFDHGRKAKLAAVGKLTKQHEQGMNGDAAWKMSDAPTEYMDGMLDNIVAFTFAVDRVVAKSKVSQNRHAKDYDAVQSKMQSGGKTRLADAMIRLKSDR